MTVCRDHLRPGVIPFWETVKTPEGLVVGVISLPPDMPDKPYMGKRGGGWTTCIRVGTTSRETTREEEARLYLSPGLFRYDIKPVPGANVNDLDERRIRDYFTRIRGMALTAQAEALSPFNLKWNRRSFSYRNDSSELLEYADWLAEKAGNQGVRI